MKKIMIFIIALNVTYNFQFFGMISTDNQPEWNNDLDYENIESQLSKQHIVSTIDMRQFLKDSNKISRFTNKVDVAAMENGLVGVFKPEDILHDSLAEVAAYKASKYLGLDLVPPTIFNNTQ